MPIICMAVYWKSMLYQVQINATITSIRQWSPEFFQFYLLISLK